ncbi:MAG TPA: MaoC/PaaZ C-terminal domain-containing protein [Acidimicrobiia bacterium]
MSQPEVRLLFDDISVGTVMTAGEPYQITADEIVEVSSRWDPQPFHLDPVAAAASHFGGLVASGLHTIAASLALGSRETPMTAAVAGLGMDDLRFLHPVRPGDRLVQTTEIVEVLGSRSRPDRGVVRARRRVMNQDGIEVLTYVLTWMVERAA